MKIGDINVIDSILTLESDLKVLQQTLIYLLENNPTLKRPTAADINSFRSAAIQQLKAKYPNMGIEEKK